MRNQIFSIADRLAGTQKARRALPKEERDALWQEAVRQFNAAVPHRRPRPRKSAKASLQAYPRIINLNAVRRSRKRQRPRMTPSKAGFIYVIYHPEQYAQEGVVKIGLSGDLKKRIGSANTWSFSGSFEFAGYEPVNNMRQAEAFLHDHFAQHRLHGEWFKVDIGTAKMMLNLVAEDFPLCPNTHQLEETANANEND